MSLLPAATALAAVVGATTAQQFAPADPDRWPPATPVLRVRERNGAWLDATSGRLVRERQGATVAIGHTTRDDPGLVIDLRTHADGSTWVATARGVFSLHQEVDLLDPLELISGTPSGRPIGLHLDARDRLWVATDREVACIRPRWMSGHLLGAEVALPAPPFSAFAAASDGSLWLRARDGVFRYVPDRGPVPTLVVERHGRPEEASLTAHQGAVRLDLAGGAGYRWRDRSHHVWHPAPAIAEVTGLKPGRHEVEVVAVDPDLNPSPAARVRIDVPMPVQFDPRRLLPFVAGAVLCITAGLVARARRRVVLAGAPAARAYAQAIVSSLLLAIIGLQITAACLGYGRAWPFVGYAMYTHTYREGSSVYVPCTMALRPDGTMVEVESSLSGDLLGGPWEPMVPLIAGDAEVHSRFLAGHRHRRPAEDWRGIQVRAERFRLTHRGPRHVAPIIFVHYEPAEPR